MREQLWMPPAKPLQSTRVDPYLWTPNGPRFLAEVSLDGDEWKPCFLGTFDRDVLERPLSDAVENRAARLSEKRRRFIHVDEGVPVVCDSSHDSNPVLG